MFPYKFCNILGNYQMNLNICKLLQTNGDICIKFQFVQFDGHGYLMAINPQLQVLNYIEHSQQMSSQKKLTHQGPMRNHKSLSKPQSITTQTRLSQSHVFNNSSLNNSTNEGLHSATNMHSFAKNHLTHKLHANQYMSNNIHDSENKEVEFLRIKNAQLIETTKRLQKHVNDLEGEKKQLLAINKKYVDVVNRYYENQNEKVGQEAMDLRKKDLNMMNEAHHMLLRLEKDHRNLVKHCLTMEEQIKKYEVQMQKFEVMKSQLRSVNHATVKDLVQQIEQLAEDNKNLKKHNNQITYELQKSKFDYQRVCKAQGIKQKEAGDTGAQLAKMQSQMNTVKQQSVDKANAYEARIYQLEIKVEKLQKELRCQQQNMWKTKSQNKELSMRQVENVHDYEKLQQSMTDLLMKNNYSRPRTVSSYHGRSKAIDSSFANGIRAPNFSKAKNKKTAIIQSK